MLAAGAGEELVERGSRAIIKGSVTHSFEGNKGIEGEVN